MHTPWTIIVDFDGTITTQDADVVIARAVLRQEGSGFIDALITDYEQLRITTAEYFARYLRRLQLTRDRFATEARRVPLRPGFHALVGWCEAENLDVVVASEGLDWYIEPILAAAGLQRLKLSCNVVAHDADGYQVDTAPDGQPCSRCITCKGALARRLRSEGRRVAMVGNGASDLCGARQADLVLARDSLLLHCGRESIDCLPWSSFADVQTALSVRDAQ